MFSIEQRAVQLCDRINRRELLRIGGLSALGLSLPQLLHARERSATDGPMFGRAKNVIFLYLLGGPPQHETFDPKPDAPVDIRGAFQPISTNVAGIQFCELLPRTARIADKLAIVRSVSTDDNNHDSSGYALLTGYKYIGPNSRTIQPTDWPYFGSLVKQLKPSEKMPPLTTVWVPDVWRLNENVTPAGQTAGFLGNQWNPDVFVGDPSQADYEVQGLQSSDLPTMRLRQRETLLSQVENHFRTLERGAAIGQYDKYQQQAFELISSGRARDAFQLSQEPEHVRARYGRGKWGRCLLLARRLVEAGVRMVHVNWPREPGDNAVDNPLWDTHAQNADRLEDVLCPQFDVGFTALIEDLEQRGMLSETLVVAVGEFGRSPKINGNGGRDHWGHVFSLALAGAGISGGQVYGASDRDGAYPIADKVKGGDFTATMFHLMGIDHQAMFADREGRPHKLTEGEPVYKLLGTEPATHTKIPAGGEIARVPPFDPTLLLSNSDFTSNVPLEPVSGPSRPKRWRAMPLAASSDSPDLVVQLVSTETKPTVLIGCDADQAIEISPDAKAFLAQEVRSPFAGRYKLVARVRGVAASKEQFDLFRKHFACKLSFFQFTDSAKSPLDRRELATVTFSPVWKADSFDEFELTKVFTNPTPGGNFSFGLGMGVALTVERATAEPVSFAGSDRVGIEIDAITLEFAGKERIENVTV